MEDEALGIIGTENGVATGTEQFVQTCESHWPAGQPRPRVVTRAPGRLDCMGGMADFSGSLALQLAIDRGVHVAVGRRDDQKIHVASLGWEGPGPDSCEWPLAWFYRSDGQFITPADLARHFEGCPWALHVASICLALLESGDVPHFGGGATLMLQSDIPPRSGLASSAAIQVATAKAMGALFDVELDAQQIARACRRADLEIVGAEPGLVDHLPCLLAEADSILQIRCQPDDVLGSILLPREVMIAGVDAGIELPIRRQRYADNRVASLLGRYLIERLLKKSGAVGDPTGGYLANIAPSEYVSRFRNDVPVKMRGRDFIEKYGRPDEFEVEIDPDQVYKIRSRTEHHIYENERAHRFTERLARARRTGERDALVEAGELMYASHWSYGQRCGLGGIETDILVAAIRERGAARGLYGAKVTGKGCGGTVAVLMANSPTARGALDEACAAYSQRTGRAAGVLIGTSPGAMGFGHRYLD